MIATFNLQQRYATSIFRMFELRTWNEYNHLRPRCRKRSRFIAPLTFRVNQREYITSGSMWDRKCLVYVHIKSREEIYCLSRTLYFLRIHNFFVSCSCAWNDYPCQAWHNGLMWEYWKYTRWFSLWIIVFTIYMYHISIICCKKHHPLWFIWHKHFNMFVIFSVGNFIRILFTIVIIEYIIILYDIYKILFICGVIFNHDRIYILWASFVIYYT